MAVRWLDAARYADTNGYQYRRRALHVALARLGDRCVQPQSALRSVHRSSRSPAICCPTPRSIRRSPPVQSQSSRQHRRRHHSGRVRGRVCGRSRGDDVDRFLGLTLGCARCHDHKYDPFTQKEFYQIFAYFNNVPELGRAMKYGNSPPAGAGAHARAAGREDELQRAEASW